MEAWIRFVTESDFFQNGRTLWLAYFPLGVIGAWRWSVWCFKKFVSFFYRPPKGAYDATLSVVTPVYNEDPEMFREALLSWKMNDPMEIIAVIDHTDEACVNVFKDFAEGFSGARLIVTHTPGKRPALADGIRAATGEIVALVDSDTVWTDGFKRKALGPFRDARVGGVAPRQDVLRADTLARRLFRIHIFNRYWNDIVYQAAFGDALSCISGRTGVYRRKAIAHLTDELVNETFFGKRCISGDDKRLTSLIQRDGWSVRYVRDALVYTSGAPDMPTYTKQQVRWTRNSWRSDLKALFSRWLWRNPFLAFHTLDRFIQPFTLLLAPIFFVIAWYRQDWIVVWILVGWWLISRSVKILGHLARHPSDIFIMPIHIVYGFFLAIVKIYTLITVDEQTWITRWDKSRLNRFGFFRKASAYAATLSVVFLLSFASYVANDRQYSQAEVAARKAIIAKAKEEKRLFRTDDMSILTIDGAQAARTRSDDLYRKLDTDPYGYYRVLPGEGLADVRRRFFLRPDTPVLDENKVALGPSSLLVGRRIAIPVEALRNPDMEGYRRNNLVPFVALPYPKQNAVRVSGKGSFVTIPELAARINNAAILENLGDKRYILRRNIFIDDGVTLVIDGDDVEWLKLKSDRFGFVWIKSENGNIAIDRTKITSWDEGKRDYDIDGTDGRSYILQKLSGRMDIRESELAYLGYFGSPNRGNPYGGPYGVSWKISNGTFRDALSTGSVIRSRIHNNLFGIYTYGATGITLSDNEVFRNIAYGIDPHDYSNHFLIERNEVFLNGTHGIIASKGCFSNIIRGNRSRDNHLHGIMLDRDSNNNLVENNDASGNVNGIALYHSSENIVVNNSLNGNDLGIRANGGSGNNFFGENVIVGNRKGVYAYGGAAGNHIFRNIFLDNRINVHLKQASDALLTKADDVDLLRSVQ